MTDRRTLQRRAMLFAALAVVVLTATFFVRAGRGRLGTEPQHLEVHSRAETPSAEPEKGLRVETLRSESPFSSARGEKAPRTAFKDASGTAGIVTKELVGLVDSPGARETVKADVRAPGKLSQKIELSREAVLKERE